MYIQHVETERVLLAEPPSLKHSTTKQDIKSNLSIQTLGCQQTVVIWKWSFSVVLF